MAGPIQLSFVQSGTDVEQLPDSPAEITFVGRSNVGKSSLINALANRKNLAHVSNTPGRTRLLNLFEVDADKNKSGRLGPTMVDLPGYGYAAAPGQMRGDWQRMIEGYLLEREPLEMVVVLVDGAVGPTKLDAQMLAWLRSHELPHTVVATKHDKVKSSQRDKRKKEVAEGCDLEERDIVWVSSTKGVGLDRLRSLVRSWLAP
ncbi:MAG: GTP-binding protein [Acidimicrobiales bacterium]|jgi:GTP-binding protein